MDYSKIVFIAVFAVCILQTFGNHAEEKCPGTYDVINLRYRLHYWWEGWMFRWQWLIEYYTVTMKCPSPNGKFQEWSSWGKCSSKCGFGEKIRTRTCTPEIADCCPSCKGNSSQTVTCKITCPIDGGWTDWDDPAWANCSAKCDSGTTKRTLTRTCTNPRPANGGKNCKGSATKEETKSCILYECPETTCKKLKNGYTSHPNPQKCNMYLHCVNKAKYEMPCPQGTAWSKTSNTCDNTAATKCLGTCKVGEYEAHPTDCSKFYHCASGTRLEYTCPDGTKWDDKKTTCDHDKNVKCNTKDSEDDAGDNAGFVCEEEGYFQHETDCHKYYQCDGQLTKHEMFCPVGLVFNEKTNICDWASAVERCSGK